MWLVVGLGNPGAKYEHNRHNIGFLALDCIAGKLGASAWGKKFNGLYCEVRLAARSLRLHLLKPQTYMNLSGESVAAAARFYKIPTENMIVLHDELDLATGKLRVKQGGGNGGHNGLRSIDASLGEDYWRVRMGISHPGEKVPASDYVLSDFSRTEWEVQEKMIEAVASHFPLLLKKDSARFMNKIALFLGPPQPL